MLITTLLAPLALGLPAPHDPHDPHDPLTSHHGHATPGHALPAIPRLPWSGPEPLQTFAFEWVEDWLQLPEGMALGNTHGGMLVTREGNILFNTDSENAVVVVRPDGTLVETWGKELAGGLHGMCLREEGGEEFLYLCHLGRHEVIKTTLKGEILWTLGYPEESGHYKSASEYRPTGVAVSSDGSLYVADGYGKSWVHQFDAERNYVRSFGGLGNADGQFRTCHGIWLDTRGGQERLIVADRENHRLQFFDLQGQHLETLHHGLRRPCGVAEWEGTLAVPDLAGRITLIDSRQRLIAHLCDNPDPKKRARNGIPPSEWAAGEFLSPHSLCWDREGSLFVMDWNARGRISKLQRLR